MALEIRQSLKLTTQLLMTPQLQQAIKLLQLSRMELEEFVAAQLSENPILEEGQTESAEERAQVEQERDETEEEVVQQHLSKGQEIVDHPAGSEKSDIDWEALSRIQDSMPTALVAKTADEQQPNYENLVTRGRTLQEHLISQAGEVDFDEQERKVANQIIGNIDDRGYLRVALDEIARQEGVDQEKIEDVLDTIQRFDPPGVGARDMKECLYLQLRQNGLKNGIVEKIVMDHLVDLESRNYQAIAKALKISLEKVVENIQIIAELEPIPGRQFGGESTAYIVPDVYTFKLGQDWMVSLNEDGLPKLRISNYYRNMLTQSAPAGHDKEYLQEKMKSALWLIKSIQQRQRTIFKVAERIVARQKDFFEFGVEHLKPMILKDVAEDIGMHESTISRVTNNKYIQSPRGIFELKYFFNSSVARSDGDAVASESVKHMIEELIRGEDPKKPLSDQRIVELLEGKNVQLARRTVAKYREQLRISPSSRRKRFF